MTAPPSDDRPAAIVSDREDPYHVTRASRIFFLPNLMTAANLFCGFMAVVNCIHARLAESSFTGVYLDATAPEHYRNAVWFISGPSASIRWMAGWRAWGGASPSSAPSSTPWPTSSPSGSPRPC